MVKIIYKDKMATSTGVVTTGPTAMTGSPYKALATGKMIGLELSVGGDAVTSLLEQVECKVKTARMSGHPVYVSTSGANLRTAPAHIIPAGHTECEIPVELSEEITCEYMHNTGATPVTPRLVLYGVFIGDDVSVSK